MTASVQDLLAIMARLRAPDGCPWDREQTLASLKPYLVEECYEVLDAIDSGSAARHAEELGDLLLQVVFQAQVRREEGAFAFEDVVRLLCEKLVRRHPHVFGGRPAADAQAVLKQWDAIKAGERAARPGAAAAPSAIGELPRHLPALHKAHHLQSRLARAGFDWDRVHDVVAKIDEELAELKRALAAGRADAVRDELGDLLFAVVNLARFQKLHAEDALQGAIDKCARRVRAVEARVRRDGRELADCSLAELDAHWNAVKAAEPAAAAPPGT